MPFVKKDNGKKLKPSIELTDGSVAILNEIKAHYKEIGLNTSKSFIINTLITVYGPKHISEEH